MTHEPNNTTNGLDERDESLIAMERSLDRLGAAERVLPGAEFDDRLAQATRFALEASSRQRWRGLSVAGLRIAAAVALLATGLTTWWAMQGPIGPGGPGVATTDPTTPRVELATGDDSEVFTLISLAMDGGAGTEIDTLLSEAATLDSTIGGAATLDEFLNGETM